MLTNAVFLEILLKTNNVVAYLLPDALAFPRDRSWHDNAQTAESVRPLYRTIITRSSVISRAGMIVMAITFSVFTTVGDRVTNNNAPRKGRAGHALPSDRPSRWRKTRNVVLRLQRCTQHPARAMNIVFCCRRRCALGQSYSWRVRFV